MVRQLALTKNGKVTRLTVSLIAAPVEDHGKPLIDSHTRTMAIIRNPATLHHECNRNSDLQLKPLGSSSPSFFNKKPLSDG
jgi:hypothetical protein